MHRNRVRNKRMELAVLTILLIMATVFLSVMTAKSRSEGLSSAEAEAYYRPMEQNLIKETGEYLSSRGMKYSGITLTRVIDAEGAREYTMTIHHRVIDAMTGEEREMLRIELGKLVFEDEHCTFSHEFLLNR